ncbi:MAG: ankyrin repeat domain-containing protein [Candidatus Endonucleobacter sp. (ex Gigantidas childressi)]|nr:ankyrin repeat domain-containing protein [Candidatus Endonucleobacter sp. (ex Gigantidas childressi)]
MKHVLSVMMLLVFFPIQRGMATLDAVDQAMPVDWILANNDIVKIIVPITLHNENSVGAMVDISGIEVPTGMLTEVFSFVYGSNENRDEIQNAGLNNKIDTVNACDTCPVTVNKLQKDGFDFVVIKQSNTECLKIHHVKVKPVAGFVSVQKTLSLKKMFSFTPIKERKVDEQAQDGLFDINNLSINLLEKDRLPLAENSSYSFVLYIPCRVKDTTDDGSRPFYAAFFFRNNGVELQKAFCKLKELDGREKSKGECYEMCSICRDLFSDQRKVVVTKCNHGYHKSCIATWFESNKTTEGEEGKTCPYCRDNKLLPLRYASNNDSDQIYFKDDPAQACIDGNLGALKNMYAQDHTICNQRFLSFMNGEQYPLLYFAIPHGHINIAKFLIKHGSDINSVFALNQSLLQIACCRNKLAIAELLLKNGAKTDHKDDGGDIPLGYAAWYGDLKMVKLLFKNTVDAHAVTEDELSALHYAAEKGKKEIVRFLLKKGFIIDAKTNSGYTAFQIACRGGHQKTAELLLEKTDVVTIDYLTESLEKACGTEHKHIIEFLLSKGARVDGVIQSGSSSDYGARPIPLHTAIMSNKVGVVEYLLEQGAKVNIENELGECPLLVAAQNGHKDIIKLLLGYNAYVDANDMKLVGSIIGMADLDLFKSVFENIDWNDILFAHGIDYLKLAVASGDCQLIKYLSLEKNMDISDKPDLVLVAILANNFETVKCLIDDLGADINDTSSILGSPIEIAINSHNAMMVDHLIKHGVKIDKASSPRLLLLAVSQKNCSVIQCLIDHKALINEGIAGLSPLHVAVMMEDMNVIKCLCENGADINKQHDNRNIVRSPFNLAKDAGKKEIVTYFKTISLRSDQENTAFWRSSLRLASNTFQSFSNFLWRIFR